jgi:hypothetical protein
MNNTPQDRHSQMIGRVCNEIWANALTRTGLSQATPLRVDGPSGFDPLSQEPTNTREAAVSLTSGRPHHHG